MCGSVRIAICSVVGEAWRLVSLTAMAANIYQAVKQAMQDLIAPQLESVKGDIAALRSEVHGEIRTLRAEMQGRPRDAARRDQLSSEQGRIGPARGAPVG